MDERIKELVFVKEVNFNDRLHYLFLTERGERKIVEATCYQSFHLQPGTALLARVRRKGSTGEEITELLHPFYVQGKTYTFKVVHTGSFTFNNESIQFLVVAGQCGDEYKIRIPDCSCYYTGGIVRCRLNEQVKGKLNFSIV